jgi:hypothetical protein
MRLFVLFARFVVHFLCRFLKLRIAAHQAGHRRLLFYMVIESDMAAGRRTSPQERRPDPPGKER